MASVVYVLCALTSLAVAGLLVRGYLRSRARLLLWSALCFVFLAINNVLLVVDVEVVPAVDLSLWRGLPVLVGLALLIFGLIWEVR